MALESNKRYVANQSAAGLGAAARPCRKSAVEQVILAGGALLDRVIRIVITVTVCLILIQLIDALSQRVFGHGAW